MKKRRSGPAAFSGSHVCLTLPAQAADVSFVMVSASVSGLTGFDTNSDAPALRVSRLLPASLRAETMMIGMLLRVGMDLNILHNWMPLISGIRISIRTTSGRTVCATSTASRLLFTDVGWCPFIETIRSNKLVVSLSSSTIKIFDM